MITFYHAPGSCSLAVKAALKLTQLKHEIKIVDVNAGEHLSDEFKKINPMSKVPAVIINGEILTEGSAILHYLSEQDSPVKLIPETGTLAKAQALKWMSFLYSNVHPHFARAFVPSRYGADINDIKFHAETSLHELFAIIDSQLKNNEFIAGDKLTLGDLYLLVAIHWQGILANGLTEKFSHLASYQTRLLAHDVIGDMYRTEFS
jgi:glutathione S-transferase